jgi:predicted dehydrogenase
MRSEQLRLITVAPGHFHAALVQQRMLPDVDPEVSVYGPVGPDLVAHLGRIARFNARAAGPTQWRIRVYAGPDYMERLRSEPPGSLVVLAGVNRGKMERLRSVLDARMHALVDKPWIIEASDLKALEDVLSSAERDRRVIFDGMTERFEITRLVQRALVNDAAVFGRVLDGSDGKPGVEMGSVHYILKLVAGAPNLRPPWFFDVHQLGEGLTDVGTHYVDLVNWTLFPDQAIDYRNEIRMLDAGRWPTPVTLDQFRRVTGEDSFPDYLKPLVGADGIQYFCNNEVDYRVRGIHTRLRVEWKFEAPAGVGDTVTAIFRGTRSSVELHQGPAEKYRAEVYAVPNGSPDRAGMMRAIKQALSGWEGMEVEDQGSRFHIVIPDRYRIGHEAHFSVLLDTFLKYVRNPESQPAWEKPNMLAKYYVTTAGVALARRRHDKTKEVSTAK